MKRISSENNDILLDKILCNLKLATHSGDKLFFIDIILEETDENYKIERAMDITKMFLNNGKIRTQTDIECFIEKNGFRIVNTDRIKEYVVVEAARI